MKPTFHPYMINGPFADPVLYVDFLFEKRALMFDIGDIRGLAARKILRLSDLFISHTHMDHFEDFDWMLRLCLGRDKRLRVFGPPGFINQVEHKLSAYTWNLVHNYETDFTLLVTELHPDEEGRQALFRCQTGFTREQETKFALPDNVLVDETSFLVRGEIFDHSIPCLGFAIEEKLHINVWKNRLKELGLPVGPWLKRLKEAVLSEQPNDTPIQIEWCEEGIGKERYLPLGELKAKVLQIVPGQKISYIVDIAYHQQNVQKAATLAAGSDKLFIEATFLQEDAELAASKYHLTAHQAGLLAREAQVKELILIQFSPRYSEREKDLYREAWVAFAGSA
jgi:ribonuclease Z